jgi:hypothetical protein
MLLFKGILITTILFGYIVDMNDSSINFNSTKELLHNSNFYYIICTDNVGNYSYINQHYANSFKHIKSNLVGQPFYITMHPDDIKVCEDVGGRCYEYPGKLFPATIRKHNGLGGYVTTQWEFILIEEKGIPQGVFCLGYDITEHEIVKKKVEIINKDLAIRNDLLGEIAFEQSHIVRAPLASIMGLVDLLKNYELDENAAEIVNMIEESSKKLDSVIRSIVNKTDI